MRSRDHGDEQAVNHEDRRRTTSDELVVSLLLNSHETEAIDWQITSFRQSWTA